MSARLSFLRRTDAEAKVQGGDVYFDINGKNVGKLTNVDCFVDLPAGTYQIKMYKSHSYGSMIGFAESSVTLKDGDDIMVRYAAPMTVAQPGNIILSDYTKAAAEQIAGDVSRQISNKVADEKAAAERSASRTKKIVTWIIIAAVATGVLWGVIYGLLYADLFNLF